MSHPATFLDCCKKVHELSGLSGSPPGAVTGQTGVNAKIVSFVVDAWITIQTMVGIRWRFMRKSFDVDLPTGSREFDLTAAPFDLTDFSSFDIDSLKLRTTGQADYGLVKWYQYLAFRERFQLSMATSGRPNSVCNPRQQSVLFNRTPDVLLSFSGDYFRTPQYLEANTDVPLCPLEHRMVIVHEALRKLALDRGTNDIYQEAVLSYRRALTAMTAAEAEVQTEYAPDSLLGPDRL